MMKICSVNQHSCAFTGHRPKSFPWKYDETASDCILLKEALAAQIAMLANDGITDWFSGMAQGTDHWSAEIVLGLRERSPGMRLHCILPCEGQEKGWAASEQERYHAVLQRADEVVYVSRDYTPGCMLKRNHYLVEHSSVLLAVYNGVWRSGTGATVRYAQKSSREIILIDPITRLVTRGEAAPSPEQS